MNAVLRVVAILIAVAGVVDPAIPMQSATRAHVAVVATEPASAAALGVRDRLAAKLAASFDVVPHVASDSAAAVVIGNRYPEDPLPDTLLISTITTAETRPSVRVVQVHAPREVPLATTIHLDVDVEAVGFSGTSTDLSARIAGLEVARATHRWSSGRQRWRAGLDAVPVGDPPWVAEVSVVTPNAVSSAVDTVVDLRRAPLRVMFYEPRPSWATTFIRRALEADRRFEIAGVSFSSRGIAARTGDAVSLADPRIDRADVVVVGGLDRLSAPDGRSLERFMRTRGGGVVLVPDARVGAGPARDLLSQRGGLPLELSERLLERSAKLSMSANLAPLEASELLVFGAPTPGVDVVAATTGRDPVPVIASMPYGSGRLLVSGAMDAWRSRANDNGAFDRFWQSTIAGLALAVPPPIDVAVEPPLLRPLERGGVVVRVRSREYAALTATVDGDQPIRLRPEPEAGVYRGTFTAKGAAGRSVIDVRPADAAQPGVSRTVLVRAGTQRAEAAAPLAMLASSHRGIDVTPDRVADLERFLREAVESPRAMVVRRPMRSAWWMLPFAACLSGEWWRRRRRGLR